MSYYSSEACDSIYPHNCDPCEAVEHGRVQSAGFIHQSYYATLMADPTNPNLWADGQQSGKIILIPRTHGKVSKGSAKTGQGFGKAIKSVFGYDFTAMYGDPNYASNAKFYNKMVGNQTHHFFYVTETFVHVTSVTVTIIPNNEVQDDLSSQLTWEVDVEWTGKDFPEPHAIPAGGLDTCFTPA